VILLGNGGTVLKLDDKGVPAIESKRSTVANTGAFSPDGRNFYEASLTDVTTYTYDAKTGVTTQPEKLELTGHVEKLGAVFMSISPDGKHVYAGQVSNGYGSAKRWFSWRFDRKADTGALAIKSSGEPERDLTQVETCLFSPDGKLGYFVQADPKDGEGYLSCPAWFTRDPDTGKLTFKGKGAAGRNCCMDYEPVVGHFYVGACGQDPKNSLIFAIKTKAFPVKNNGK
jgi:WD40 repeat protein